MLFRKKIDPRCAYCAKGTRLSDEEVACVKCGIVAAEHHCGAFRYDLSDNDYLGLARRDDLRRDFMARCEAPLTAAASRLLASRQEEAVELEVMAYFDTGDYA